MTKDVPYYLLIITAIILFFIRFFVSGKPNLIINVGATYFVTALKDAIVFFGIVFLIFGIFYWLSDKFKLSLNAILSNIHIFGVLILSFLFFYFGYKSIQKLNQKQVIIEIRDSVDFNFYMIICLIAIILLQSVFFINIFVAMINKSDY